MFIDASPLRFADKKLHEINPVIDRRLVFSFKSCGYLVFCVLVCLFIYVGIFIHLLYSLAPAMNIALDPGMVLKIKHLT